MFEIIPNWHPLFVHFTVSLLSLSVIFFIIQRPLAETETGDNFLLFARYTLWIGVLFSVITLIAGWDAYNTVNHDTPSHTAMTDHRNWGLATFTVFLVAAIWWLAVYKANEKASILFLVLLLAGGGLLVTTGHKGSQLVYFYGLGVKSIPAKDDHTSGGGHNHSHGGEEAEGDHHGAQSAEPAHSHDEDHGDDHHVNGEMPAVPEDMEMPEDMSMDSQTMDDDISESVSKIIPTPPPVIKATEVAPPKIETYEDGTIRQTLPEVDLGTQ